MIHDGEPCYIFIRKSENAKDWVFISFTPESSSVKEKMLYSSTRATMKLEFGGTYICFEYSATTVDEVTLSGYLMAKESKEAPPPLTLAEQDLKDQDEHEVIKTFFIYHACNFIQFLETNFFNYPIH